MSFSACKYVWKNGELVPWENATVHVSCHGLHYGTGVFEGIRCYSTPTGPVVFRLKEHIERWFASASVYGMQLPYSLDELSNAVLQVVSANAFDSCYIRPIAFFGSHRLSVSPAGCPVEVVIFAWPWGQYLGGDAVQEGVRITVSKWQKFASEAIPAQAKACGQYLNSVLAIQDAFARGFDEALLLDGGNTVAEGSGENLFLVKDGQLCTNDETSPVLIGITRDAVLQLAAEMGIPSVTGKFTLEQVRAADEAFFTGTAVEVTPVVSLDDVPIGSGVPGPVTKALQKAFFDVTGGRDPRFSHWLTPASHSKACSTATGR